MKDLAYIYYGGIFMVLNFGELNEIKFVEYLNNKKFSELNPMFQNFIEDLFGKVIMI